MSDWATAWDTLTNAIGSFKGKSSGSIDDLEHLSPENKLKVAEITAILAVAQELSALNPQNTQYRDDEGTMRNGWAIETHGQRMAD